MIAYLQGVVQKKDSDRVVIDVQGVGYEVFVSSMTLTHLPDIGEDTSLSTYLHVREGIMQLFGFKSQEERDLFETLIGISGIGPKVGISILSVFSVPSFIKAVAETDIDAITTIPGIGPKGAKRIILELQEKLVLPDDLPKVGEAAQETYKEVRDALIGLGYSIKEANQALECVSGDEDMEAKDLLKQALKNLSQV